MLSDIEGITLRGANFEQDTDLPFFRFVEGKSKSVLVKSTIIYGRNGTGKSTISRAFNKLAGKHEDSILSVTAWDKQREKIILDDDEKDRIFVFNEDFVDQNVKTKEKGLDTIVILGEQVDLNDKIEKTTKELNSYIKKGKAQSEICAQYKDKNNTNSPLYWKNSIDQALRGDDHWAGRDSEINSNSNRKRRKNTPVSPNTYSKFINLHPSELKENLIKKYKQLIEEKKQIESGQIQLKIPVPQTESINKYCKFHDDELIQLLALKIEKPNLSEREKKLLSLLNADGLDELKKRENTFSDDNVKTCPYCFQSLTPSYKESLVHDIKIILKREVQEHQALLEKLKRNQIELEIDSSLSRLNSYKDVVSLLNKLNSAVDFNNQKIEEKISDPYTPIFSKEESISKLADRLKENLNQLEKERRKFNNGVQNTTEIVQELHSINDQIAYYDIEELYKNYLLKKKEASDANQKLERYRKQYVQTKQQLQSLESQKRNTKIAVRSINSFLNYIFGTNKRLQLKANSSNEYTLISRGQNVKPSEVSEGERNILGLCYFFTRLLKGKEIKQAYTEKCLLIIDDPISSFDEENKVGILSFLKLQLDNFLGNNKDSKAIVMTHDVQIFFDLLKIFKELKSKYKGYNWGKLKFNQFQLEKGKLQKISDSHFSRYNFCLEQIYKFATGDNENYDDIIGNMMRQVLEAFSTFKYQQGIEQVSNDPKILNTLEKPYRTYFYNLMYRLILHGDSHLQDNVRSMNDLNFFAIKPAEEKQRIARDILCFIYKLDKLHFEYHARSIPGFNMDNIQKWCQDIKENQLPELDVNK